MAARPLRDMLVAMTDTDTQSKLAEYEDMIRLLTAKCEQLASENARLRSSENTAHSVLREVYNDPSASPNVRVLAAKAAIAHESAPLKPVEAPLELVVEEVKPLHQLVEEQRARAAKLWATHEQFRGLRVRRDGVLPLPAVSDGNGSDDDTAGG
jgi:hypothetical protein